MVFDPLCRLDAYGGTLVAVTNGRDGYDTIQYRHPYAAAVADGRADATTSYAADGRADATTSCAADGRADAATSCTTVGDARPGGTGPTVASAHARAHPHAINSTSGLVNS